MTAAISYFNTGASMLAFLALWFFYVYQALSRKKKDVFHAEEQVKLFRECFQKMRNSPDEASAGRMLETSIQLYVQAVKTYNEILLKPAFRFPGSLMGFRRAEGVIESKEEDLAIYICEDCGFTFYEAGETGECPYCGKRRIHASFGKKAETLRLFLERE